MLKTDFANQFYRIRQKETSPSRIGFTFAFTTALVSAFLILIFPTNNTVKIHQKGLSPSNYQAFLKEYLSIFENYSNTYSLPRSYEESLKQAAKNALVLSQEGRVYYPNNQELVNLSSKIETEVGNKFPELIAKK